MRGILRRIGERVGWQHGGERYQYGDDPIAGPVNERHRPERWVRTTCGYCSVGCGMLVGVRDGRAVTVRGDPDHPVNRGRLCPKGLSEHETLAAPGRLTRPLVRREGAFVPVDWDTALDAVVGGFGALLDRHGPEAVAILSTGQAVTEELYALGKLARLGMGLAHYDGNTTLCMASAVSGYKLSFGSDGPPGAYSDLEDADCILLVGANIADNHPLLAPRVLENGRATVIVVDPRVTKTAAMADLHLPIRPRTDITLINGILRVLVDENLIDHDYVADHTEGWDELVVHLDDYPLERVAAECGVPVADIRAAALAFGRAERGFVAWTMGVNHSVQGSETAALLNTLCLVTGNVGRPGAAPFSITGQCNAMGSRETSFTSSMPGYRPFEDPDARRELAALWGVDEARLPRDRGRAYPDIINGIVNGRIKGLWVVATNPVVSYPNREVLELAFSKLDLLVVQDGFETPTTARADVVLPAAIWGEKEGTFTNSERRVSRVRRAVEPPGEARSDFDIVLAVAEKWGCREELFSGWTEPKDAFDEWRRVSASRLCDYSGITYDRIDVHGGVQWPCPKGADPAGAGEARLYTDGNFPTPSGRARLHRVHALPFSEQPRDRYPLVLNTGRTVEHWHTRTKTGRVPILQHLAPEAWLELNPADAARAGIRSGEGARVVSQRGTIEHIPVRVTAIVREGEVFIPFHFDEMCANRLTLDEFDPISREPNYKQCAVRVERA